MTIALFSPFDFLPICVSVLFGTYTLSRVTSLALFASGLFTPRPFLYIGLIFLCLLAWLGWVN
jgi:hypothetical protein